MLAMNTITEASDLSHHDRYSNTPLIQLQQVVKTYQNNANEFMALKGINASFSRGEYVGIIGKSGAGKTTLVNMLSGVDQITSGEVIVDGVSIHHLDESELALWRGNQMGVVFQFFQLLPMLNLLDNIMLPMDFCHRYHPRKSFERAMHLLELVELEDHAYKLPSAISGGQQQRVAIARALANDPPILVADEPTGSLDSNTAETIYQIFDELVKQEKTILIVSHDPTLTERVDRSVLIADGEIIDEDIARIFPQLTHQQMLQLSHHLKSRTFMPGEVIAAQNTVQEHFYIVAEGQIIQSSEQSNENQTQPQIILNPGDFFGEIELIKGGNALFTAVSSPAQPARLKILDRQVFLKTMHDSPATKSNFAQVVRQKLE